MDELDRAILQSLNEDARKSYRDIAKELHVSLSTVSHRIKKLEEEGIIRGYIPLIDAQKVGYTLPAMIGVKIGHGKMIEVQKKIARDARAWAVYDVTGEWDSMILARFKDREELNAFVKDILATQFVETTYTQVVLNVMKEERRVQV